MYLYITDLQTLPKMFNEVKANSTIFLQNRINMFLLFEVVLKLLRKL